MKVADDMLLHAYKSLAPSGVQCLLDAASEFFEFIPAPRHMEAFDGTSFTRLPGHRRSFYLKTDTYCVGADSPVLVLKGCEAASENLRSDLHILQTSASPEKGLSLLDYLVIVEGKLPLALSKSEVWDEFLVAERLHEIAIEKTVLLRTAFPVAVYEHDEATSQRYKEIVFSMLSIKGKRMFAEISRGGLFIYTYLYPTAPVRVSNLPDFQCLTNQQRALANELFSSYDLKARWLSTLHFFYSAGVRVNRKHCEKNGVCVDLNNATIDGGLLDLDGCSVDLPYKSGEKSEDVLSLNEMELMLQKTISIFNMKLGRV